MKKTAHTPTLLLIGLLAACTGAKKEHAHASVDSVTHASVAMDSIKTFANVDASVKTQLNGLLDDYFALNQALIDDNETKAKDAAKKLDEAIARFDMSGLDPEQMTFYHRQIEGLRESLQGMRRGADIEEVRSDLSSLSDHFYALVKAYHPNTQELYYQFCPMAKDGAGASWISRTKEIANPYMGQRMLTCGKTKEVIN